MIATLTVDSSPAVEQVQQTAADVLPYVLALVGLYAFYRHLKAWSNDRYMDSQGAVRISDAEFDRISQENDKREFLAETVRGTFLSVKEFYELPEGSNVHYNEYVAAWFAHRASPDWNDEGDHSLSCECSQCVQDWDDYARRSGMK